MGFADNRVHRNGIHPLGDRGYKCVGYARASGMEGIFRSAGNYSACAGVSGEKRMMLTDLALLVLAFGATVFLVSAGFALIISAMKRGEEENDE